MNDPEDSTQACDEDCRPQMEELNSAVSTAQNILNAKENDKDQEGDHSDLASDFKGLSTAQTTEPSRENIWFDCCYVQS